MQREQKMSGSQAAGLDQGQTLLEQQRNALEQAESVIREQRSEVARMSDELAQVQDAIRSLQTEDIAVLVEENDYLRKKISQLDNDRESTGTASVPAEVFKQIEELRAENNLLQQLIEQKDNALRQAIENQQEAPAPAPLVPKDVDDLESYEAELNRYRKQLEEDRERLTREIEQLRVRNEELDEATREMEMELSRERAELARERTRLDRMRQEVRTEVEKRQRDGEVRASLAPVQRLREQIKK